MKIKNSAKPKQVRIVILEDVLNLLPLQTEFEG